MIPSLLQIPSAVSDSQLHSVLPNNGKGDFQFERSTGATRINKDGLIEEVGYFSSELVQNGDFSELGSELVTNGTFNTDINWTKGGGWIISDGKAQRSAQSGSTSIYQSVSFVAGKTYKIQYDLDISAGEFNIRISGGTLIATTGRTTSGTYAEYIVANSGNNVLNLRANNAAFVGSVDNVSVKQVDPNDRWTLGTGWSYGDGVVSCDGTQTSASSLVQDIGTSANNKVYKIQFTLSNRTAGGIRIYLGGYNAGTVRSANGTYTELITASSASTNASIYFEADAAFVGSVDNVSVKQVDPNDRWTLGTGYSYGNSLVNYDDTTTNTKLTQTLTITANKNYKVKFTISNASTFARINIGDAFGSVDFVGTNNYTNGSYSLLFTPSSSHTTFSFSSFTESSTFTISNISLVEVQGDRPRLSYDITNGVVEDKPHLLLEPSSTNLVTFSESINQYNPFKSTITPNSVTSPQGLVNAVNFAENSENNLHYFDSNSIAVTSGTKYTISVFAKYNGRFLTIQGSSPLGGAFATFNLQNGTIEQESVGDASIEAMPNDWYRCALTVQMNSTGNAVMSLLLNDSATGGRSRSYLGDGASGVYLYGFQTEQQTYATSYIPTAGTTITRAAETCNNSKPSVNSTEGVFYCEIQALASDSTNRYIALSDGSLSNRVNIFFDASNVLRGFVTGISSMPTSATITDFNKIALKYKSGDISLFLNGSEVATKTDSISLSGLNTVAFDNGGGSIFYGKVKGLAVYNEALSESQLMQLTGVTASSIYNNFVTRTASFTVEALNEVKKVIDNL